VRRRVASIALMLLLALAFAATSTNAINSASPSAQVTSTQPPTEVYVEQLTTVFSQQSQVWSLEFNTPSELGLDIVFVPEGYALNEMNKFRDAVENYYRVLVSIEPFSRYRNVINIWRIDTTIDFGARRDPTMPRLLIVNSSKVILFVKSLMPNLDLDFSPPDDQIIVLVNTQEYGGSGGAVAVSYTGAFGAQVMIHEFGHTFGGLGDEYVVYDSDYPAGLDIPYPNIDWDGSKWRDIPGTGAYLGAWYRNLVRPTYDSCIMRRVDYLGFCPVCIRALEARLKHYSPPITLRVSTGIAGINVKIGSSSYMADYKGDVSVILGRGNYTIALEDIHQVSEHVRYSFMRWEDGLTSPNRTVHLASDTTIKAFYQLQYALQIKSTHKVPTTFFGAGWYNAGSTAKVAVEPIVIDGDIKYVFNGWQGDIVSNLPSVSIVMDNYKIITANWRRQFYVTIKSPHGSSQGSGWHDEGSTAKISIEPLVVTEGQTRYVFERWTGDYSGASAAFTLLVDAPKVIVALWRTQYYLTINSDYGTAIGSGWYDSGSTAKFSVKQESVPMEGLWGVLGARYVFEGWSGDFTEGEPKTIVPTGRLEAVIFMDRPHTITAKWRADYTVMYLSISAIISSIGAITFLSSRWLLRRDGGSILNKGET